MHLKKLNHHKPALKKERRFSLTFSTLQTLIRYITRPILRPITNLWLPFCSLWQTDSNYHMIYKMQHCLKIHASNLRAVVISIRAETNSLKLRSCGNLQSFSTDSKVHILSYAPVKTIKLELSSR